MVGKISDRRLGQAGGDGEDGERKAQIDIADAELGFEKGKQHWQHEHVEMADPMGRRNRGERAQRGVRFCLIRYRQNVDNVSFRPVSIFSLFCGPGRRSPKLPAAGYLSMNTAAWQPSRRVPTRGEGCLIKYIETRALYAEKMGYGIASSKAGPGTCFRRKQHVRAGSDYD